MGDQVPPLVVRIFNTGLSLTLLLNAILSSAVLKICRRLDVMEAPFRQNGCFSVLFLDASFANAVF